jgi:drug/metabolite transporter (DMT)-like permease
MRKEGVNPYLNWSMLIGFTLFWLPLAAAQSAGWTPPWPRRQRGHVRLLGVAGLVLYAGVLVNTVPRLARADAGTLAYASYTGSSLIFVYAALLIVHACLAGKARDETRRGQGVGDARSGR